MCLRDKCVCERVCERVFDVCVDVCRGVRVSVGCVFVSEIYGWLSG